MQIGDFTVVSLSGHDIQVSGPNGQEVRIGLKNGQMYVTRGSESEILPDSVNGKSAVLVRPIQRQTSKN